MKFSSSFSIETKSWQKHQSLSDSNNLADFNNVNKYFLPRKSSQKTYRKKILTKNSKKFPKKIKEKSKKFPNNFSKIPNFENIQFPISHLGLFDHNMQKLGNSVKSTNNPMSRFGLIEGKWSWYWLSCTRKLHIVGF